MQICTDMCLIFVLWIPLKTGPQRGNHWLFGCFCGDEMLSSIFSLFGVHWPHCLHEHVTPALQQLHWLPIDYRITYKLCLIMHLVHTSRVPEYLSDCVQTVARCSRRPGLRSSDTAAYVKPRCRTKFGECGFCYARPAAWNSLPHHLHQINDSGLFKRRLKTELFRRAYHC